MIFAIKEILKGIGALILEIAVYVVLFLISPWLALAYFIASIAIALVRTVAEDNSAGNSTENSER